MPVNECLHLPLLAPSCNSAPLVPALAHRIRPLPTLALPLPSAHRLGHNLLGLFLRVRLGLFVLQEVFDKRPLLHGGLGGERGGARRRGDDVPDLPERERFGSVSQELDSLYGEP